MAKKTEPEPRRLSTQTSTTVRQTMTGGGFTLEAERVGATVDTLRLARHGHGQAPPLAISRSELYDLVLLLTQARDELVPALERYGVEEED